MEKEIYLARENAEDLEKRIFERMPESYSDHILAESVYKIAARAAIIALQEYERMKLEDGQE